MRRYALTVLALATLTAFPARAEVVRIVIESYEDVLYGRSFGDVGPYEKIIGKIYFAFDPSNPVNARIVDIEKAPRNADGRVEAWAEFMILRPVNPVPGGSVGLLEVSNRGGKATLSYFHRAARSLDPTSEEDFGTGTLMRMGVTIIWVGWQHDVPLRDGLLRLHVPVVTEDGEPITGLVRADWVVEAPTEVLRVGHRDHVAYPVADPQHPDNVLTVRDDRKGGRDEILRQDWRFVTDVDDQGVEHLAINLTGGFEPGRIYELVYRATEPRVVGLGLAAVRDMMSYAKYDPSSPFPVDHGIALGISQTGRFLRHFIYQGFNTDERGRMVFDGLFIHSAGAGRGSFNHRFAQPSRDAHRFSAFFYPTDLFPFTGRTLVDPETGARDGLFAHLHDRRHLPKIFYTNTGYEYWGRAASLVHTTVRKRNDIRLHRNERLYHLASGQHFVDGFPPSPDRAMPQGGEIDVYRGNPLNFLFTLRALMVRMVEWVRDGIEPPASAYPHFADEQLVDIDEVAFPDIPDVDFPDVVHVAYRMDYGPRWDQGIIDKQPPDVGDEFPVYVPQVDSLGNELGGLRAVELRVPIATYAPWNLRVGLPGDDDELTDFRGTYIPLPRTEEERLANLDPRPSIETLYASRDIYLALVEREARVLVAEGTLLREDVPAVVDRARAYWRWIMQR